MILYKSEVFAKDTKYVLPYQIVVEKEIVNNIETVTVKRIEYASCGNMTIRNEQLLTKSSWKIIHKEETLMLKSIGSTDLLGSALFSEYEKEFLNAMENGAKLVISLYAGETDKITDEEWHFNGAVYQNDSGKTLSDNPSLMDYMDKESCCEIHVYLNGKEYIRVTTV